MSRSMLSISLIASLTTTESSIFLCRCMICSAFCWNCLGLTSSAPILRGFSMLLDATSLNRFAKSWDSRRYCCSDSPLPLPLNTLGIAEISTSWLSLAMNPFSSKESS